MSGRAGGTNEDKTAKGIGWPEIMKLDEAHKPGNYIRIAGKELKDDA